jgi:3',5'-cyclic AMP phosphodiesterase CpdA
VSRPFVLVQLSDPHVGADWQGRDPVAALVAAVEAVRRLPDGPDAVVVTGDLAEHGADAEYEFVRDTVGRLGVPVHALAGNHDDRAALRRAFGLAGAGDEPVQYAADLGPLRLVALDTTVPGEDGGRLDAARLDWLDATLGGAPAQPTLLAMHHPPLRSGVAVWDAIGLPPGDRAALGEVVRRHPQVLRLVAGHLHRTLVGDVGGRAALAVPSTYVQSQLDFGAPTIELGSDPPGFAVHSLRDGELASHVLPVG